MMQCMNNKEVHWAHGEIALSPGSTILQIESLSLVSIARKQPGDEANGDLNSFNNEFKLPIFTPDDAYICAYT